MSRNRISSLVLTGMFLFLSDTVMPVQGFATPQVDAKSNSDEIETQLQQIRAQAAAIPDDAQQRRFLQRQLPEVSQKFALANDDVQAWALIGELADIEATSNVRSSTQAMAVAAAALHRKLINMPADERYSLLLKWTMPDDSHDSVRMLNAFTGNARPPSDFARALGERPAKSSFGIPHIGELDGIFSTAWLLAAAAEESGELFALKRALRSALESNVDGAEQCLLLAEIAGEQDEAAFIEETRLRLQITNELTSKNIANATWLMEDYVLAVACLQNSQLRNTAMNTLKQLAQLQKSGGDRTTRVHTQRAILHGLSLLGADAAASGTRRRGEDAAFSLGKHVAPRYWIGTTVEDGTRRTTVHAAGPSTSTWLSHENHLMHFSGRDLDFLCFRYPLTGNFQFSVEGQDGGADAMASGVTWNGLAYRVGGYRSGPIFSLTSPDKKEQQEEPCPFVFNQYAAQFNELSVGQQGNRSTMFVNRQTMWTEIPPTVRQSEEADVANAEQNSEETITGSSPWVGLRCSCEITPLFRNLRITGKPVIPRQVLLSQSGLRGWIASWFGESRSPVFQQSLTSVLKGMFQEPEKDWSITDGVISKKSQAAGNDNDQPSPGRLYYFRPLQDKETVTYEFYNEASNQGPAIFPTVGRLAWLLQPDDVQMRWIVSPDSEWTGLPADNAISDPLSRRGPRQLPLVENDWNRVTVSVADNAVTLTLNDVEICVRKLEPGNTRQFGFLTDPQHGRVEIRNVVLTGDWPETLSDDIRENLAAPAEKPTPKQSRALTEAFGDYFLAEDVASVRQHAKTLSPEERYQFLSDWVLPGEHRKTFRLNGHFSSLSPAPPVAEYTDEETERLATATAAGESRVLVGGSLFSAAFDLIATAKAIGQLDELRDRVAATEKDAADKPFDHANRSRLAMLALIDISAEEFERSCELLLQLGEIAKTQPIRNPAERWPEMLAFYEGIRHPATGPTVHEPLFQFIFRDLHGGPGTGSDVWDRQLLALMGFKKITESAELSRDDYFKSLPLKQWAPAEFDSAFNRRPGMPGSRWMAHDRGISQLSGHENDFLYFQSPLTGDYDIEGLTTTFDWRECELFFNGKWAGPAWGMTNYEAGDHRRNYSKPRLAKKMGTDVGDWFHIRMQSKNGVARMFANGRQLYEEPMPPNHDPWIGGRFWHRYHGGIRDIRITGTPTIPDALQLLHDKRLTGWAAYYDKNNFSSLNNWGFDGEQLTAVRIMSPANANYERLLRYHRPMVEDGTISYEFYHQPDAQHVHPVLDRLVFLLDEDAVRIHWCTDGAFERSGLSPDNSLLEPEHQRTDGKLPLRPNAWNRMSLQLEGNTVHLSLNDQLVFERPLEASNMRRFGLFYFPGKTGVRVRSVVWKGNWPKTLPDLQHQELADVGFINKLDAEADQLVSKQFDFATANVIPPELQVNLDTTGGNISEVRLEAGGLHTIQQSNTVDGWRFQSIQTPNSLMGDFDITTEFDQLKANAPENKERFSGVDLSLKLDCEPLVNVFFHARRDDTGRLFLDTMTEHKRVDKTSRWDVQSFNQEVTAGRLRLARRGTTLHYLFSNGDSSQFRLLRTQTIPDAPVKARSVQLETAAGSVGQASVVWKQISLRAESVNEE